MDSTSVRISPSPRLQSLKILTPAAAHSRLAGNKHLADQCLHTEEGTEVTGQEQNITHRPKKVSHYLIHSFSHMMNKTTPSPLFALFRFHVLYEELKRVRPGNEAITLGGI